MFTIHVNGRAEQIQPGSSVADLLRDLGLADKPVAVERNCEVVPKQEHASCSLKPGDKLELVSFVGGG